MLMVVAAVGCALATGALYSLLAPAAARRDFQHRA